MSASVHYVGFDIHKKMIAYCVKTKGGKIRDEATIRATRQSPSHWVAKRSRPWILATEATLAVARKMVAYLMSVDKHQKDYEVRLLPEE